MLLLLLLLSVVVGAAIVVVSVCIVDATTAVAVIVGAAVSIDVVLLMGSHFRAHRRSCFDVSRLRSAVGDVDARRFHSDAGRV